MGDSTTAQGRGAVDEQRHGGGAADVVERGDRLEGPDLAVGVLEGDERRRVGAEGAGQRITGDAAQPVDGQWHGLRVGVVGLVEQDGTVCGGGDDARAHASAGVAEPRDPGAQGVGAARVERDLVGSRAEGGGDALAGPVEQVAGPSTLAVQAPWVGPARVESGEQGLPGGGVQRAAGGVQHAPTVTPPVPWKFRTMH